MKRLCVELQMDNAIKFDVQTVNFIKAQGLNQGKTTSSVEPVRTMLEPLTA